MIRLIFFSPVAISVAYNGTGSRIVTIASLLVAAAFAVAFIVTIIYMHSKKMKFIEEIERSRINLFSDITHKFRTSLTGIVSIAEDLMANNTKNRTIQRNAMDIISQCNSLLDLVNKTQVIIDIVPGYAIENPDTPVLQPDQMGGQIADLCQSRRRSSLPI